MCLVLVKSFCFTCILFSWILFMQIVPLWNLHIFSTWQCVALSIEDELFCCVEMFGPMLTQSEVTGVSYLPVSLLHVIQVISVLALISSSTQHLLCLFQTHPHTHFTLHTDLTHTALKVQREYTLTCIGVSVTVKPCVVLQHCHKRPLCLVINMQFKQNEWESLCGC